MECGLDLRNVAEIERGERAWTGLGSGDSVTADVDGCRARVTPGRGRRDVVSPRAAAGDADDGDGGATGGRRGEMEAESDYNLGRGHLISVYLAASWHRGFQVDAKRTVKMVSVMSIP